MRDPWPRSEHIVLLFSCRTLVGSDTGRSLSLRQCGSCWREERWPKTGPTHWPRKHKLRPLCAFAFCGSKDRPFIFEIANRKSHDGQQPATGVGGRVQPNARPNDDAYKRSRCKYIHMLRCGHIMPELSSSAYHERLERSPIDKVAHRALDTCVISATEQLVGKGEHHAKRVITAKQTIRRREQILLKIL